MATTTTNFGWDIPQSTDLVKDGATAIAALGQDIDTALVDLKGGTTGQVLAKASGTDLDFSWVAQDDSNAIQNAIVDAKGDLISATAADTPARLAVGANGTVLTADSAEATGLKWAAAPSALTLITTQAISGVTSQSVNNCFSATYQNYVIVFSANCATSANLATLKLRASGTDSSVSYYSSYFAQNLAANTQSSDYASNDTSWRARPLGQLNTGADDLTGINMTIFNPFEAKKTTYFGNYSNPGTSGAIGMTGGYHDAATSYDGFTITNATAMTGTVRVYGLAN
jgi:hypothetical protein